MSETGDNTVTVNNWRTSKPFLLFANTYIRTISDLMYEPTGLYNNAGYVTGYRSKQAFLSAFDFARAMESYVFTETATMRTT